MSEIKRTLVNKTPNYKMEEVVLDIKNVESDWVVIGSDENDVICVSVAIENGFRHGDTVIYGYLDDAGEDDELLVFIIKSEELSNTNEELLKHLLDNCDDIDELESWITERVKTCSFSHC